MILTNDGDFALRVSHRATACCASTSSRSTHSEAAAIERLRRGVIIDERRVVPKSVEMVRPTASGSNSWWKVVVGEGKRHEVRELFSRHGHGSSGLSARRSAGADERLKPGLWRI